MSYELILFKTKFEIFVARKLHLIVYEDFCKLTFENEKFFQEILVEYQVFHENLFLFVEYTQYIKNCVDLCYLKNNIDLETKNAIYDILNCLEEIAEFEKCFLLIEGLLEKLVIEQVSIYLNDFMCFLEKDS